MGQHIKALRTFLKMTQLDVALDAGMDLKNYVKIEQGEANPTVITLSHIASALKVSLSNLLMIN
jgi:transcriptional regulator with XRE-family HTH domain